MLLKLQEKDVFITLRECSEGLLGKCHIRRDAEHTRVREKQKRNTDADLFKSCMFQVHIRIAQVHLVHLQ